MSSILDISRITTPDGIKLVKPHPEWVEHNINWCWLHDSFEGGADYRTAVYGYDTRGFPVRNLRRHKFEYPMNGEYYNPPANADQSVAANEDTYELRRSRTPIPMFTREAIELHLAKIWKHEVDREAPAQITEWWKDVDNKGTSIDDYMSQTLAPLFLVLGQIDVIVDLPAVPPGETLTSRADEWRLGMDVPLLSYILPENMIWWELDRIGYYERCLVREVKDDGCQYRYWTKEFWAVFDEKGEPAGYPELHPYGRVPICRVMYKRRAKCRNVGWSRYEETADLQREYYNRDSELILSDTLQCHPMTQGPEDFFTPDSEIKTGPNFALAKKKVTSGAQTFYEGWDILDFPKGASESIRQNKNDIRDAVDRANALIKPAGAAGTGASTVSQSGISKQMDQAAGNDLLAEVAKSLQRLEGEISELYYLVAGKGKLDLASLQKTTVIYPTQFDLMGPLDLAEATDRVQLMLGSVGIAPLIEETLLSRLIQTVIPGLDDDRYDAMDKELKAVIKKAVADRAAGMNVTTEAGPMVLAGNKGWPGVGNPPGQQGTIDGGQGAGPTAGATTDG